MNKSKVQYIAVPSDHADRRIDNFLLNQLKGLPKSRLYRLMRKGEIRVNKKRIKPDYRLQADDVIRVAPISLEESGDSPKPSTNLIKQIESSVIFENENLLVLNKPSGLAVHGGSGLKGGLIEALRAARPEHKYFELAHRLDRETSGCLLLAKRPKVLRELHELLREGRVNKTYQALTLGHWKNRKTRVDVSLQKNILQSGERMVKVSPEGKRALTEFIVLENFDGASLMEVHLFTGRTHQIRVHAAHAGHPLAGDVKYGDKSFNRLLKRFSLGRLFLHAKSLSFSLSDGERVRVEAELPPELLRCLQELKR